MADEEVKQAEQSKEKKAQAKERSKVKKGSAAAPTIKPRAKKKGLMEKAKEKIQEAKGAGKEEKEAKIVLEREYIIPLRKEWRKVPEYKRANKAVKAIKQFIAKHMKIYDRDLRKVKIDILLNNEIRFRGIKKPAPKIKVKAIKYDDDTVKVNLVDIPKHIEFAIAREAKKAAEVAKKSAEKAKPAEDGGEVVEQPVEEEKPKEELKEDKEAKEKKESSKEAMQKLEKAQAKVAKHTTKAAAKQPVVQRKALQK